MKRFLLSSVFALLVMFSAGSKAYADEFCALGSYSAGEEISAYIALVSSEAEISVEALPSDFWIKESPGDNGKHLSLEGKSMAAGDINFSIIVSEEPGIINCSAHFEPALPQISIPGNISCSVGDAVELHVSAYVTDGGTLSYQWFSGAGLSGSPIEGANQSTYRPDSSVPGQQAYFCQVTNNNNSHSCTAESDVIFLSVESPRVNGISIESMPAKLKYAPGDNLDTAGLSLRVSYDNGSSEVIDQGFEISPTTFDAPGRQLVELYYEGFRCYYEVEISMSAAVIDGIGVLTLPGKTEYNSGEYIDTTGLVIRAYSGSRHFDIDSGFEVSPQKLSKEGRQTITVTFQGKSCSFTVTVKDSNKLNSIDIASLPTRREYAVGDTVDVSGLSLRLIYGGRTEIVASGFDWSPKQLYSAGVQEITVTYGELSTRFSINVSSESAKPSPSPTATAKPSPTAAPESESPSPTPQRVDRDHQAKDVNALVKIIFAVAVISLIGLAGYILWMQKRGRR